MGTIDDDFQMQAMIDEQNVGRRAGLALPSRQLAGFGQPGFRAAIERYGKRAVFDCITR